MTTRESNIVYRKYLSFVQGLYERLLQSAWRGTIVPTYVTRIEQSLASIMFTSLCLDFLAKVLQYSTCGAE